MEDKRRIIVEDHRASRDGAADSAAAEQSQSEGLVDLGGNEEVSTEVPAQDPELSADGPVHADSAADAEQIEHWRARAAEYLELAQRTQAEFQNHRKRVSIDVEEARRFAVEGLLESLFPALDGLALASAQYRNTPDGENPLLDGLRRTVKVIEAALLKHGIEKINTVPTPYNPEIHQALSVEESSEVSEETVVEIYTEGYRLGSTVLKPAMVRVAKPA